MPVQIPQTFINELLSRINIVDLIERYIQLKKMGQNYVATCPFHQEKTPSFSVSPQKQFYYCFGCGASGNAISFIMAYERLGFIEAIEQIASSIGLSIPQQFSQTKDNASKTLYALMEKVARFYQQQLFKHPAAQAAQQYLKKRGLSKEMITRFNIGFAPPGWHTLLNHLNQNQQIRQQLLATGMLIEKENNTYDRFRNRIMYCIRDRRGRVIGFSGRTITDDTPKYLNSPETTIFHKRKELYGLYEALQHNRQLQNILIVEGPMDVLALVQHHVTNVVATLGTATSLDHLSLLLRYTKEIVFCFDGDDAGKHAAWRALETVLPLLKDGINIRFMFLPQSEDPDSMIRKEGSERFKQQIQQATSFAEFFFEHIMSDIDISDPAGKAKIKNLAKPLLQKLPSGIFQQLMIEQLASLIRVNVNKLTPFMLSTAPETMNEPAARPPKRTTVTPMRLAISLLLQHPTLSEYTLKMPEIRKLTIPGYQILLNLLDIIEKTPTITTGGLIEYFRDDDNYRFLVELARWVHPISDTQGLANEFKDCITKLILLQKEREVEQLLIKANTKGLDTQQKERLQHLIKTKHEALDRNE